VELLTQALKAVLEATPTALATAVAEAHARRVASSALVKARLNP
jgi:hypothetical protein